MNSDTLTATDPSTIDPNCTQNLSEGGTITVYYDQDSEQITMNVSIPTGSYAGFGWGGSMTNTEMVIFSTKDGTGGVTTYYGVGDDTPNAQPSM